MIKVVCDILFAYYNLQVQDLISERMFNYFLGRLSDFLLLLMDN